MPARDNGSEGYGEYVVLWQHRDTPSALWRTKLDAMFAHDDSLIDLMRWWGHQRGTMVNDYSAGRFRTFYHVIEINSE